MIEFELLGFIFDWTNFTFQISIASLTYPFGNVFRTDSLFAFVYSDADRSFYLELFFVVIIGEKG